MTDSPILRDMIDTIESLQRENEALLIDGRIKKILYKQIEALQHEIEQLKADLRGKDNEINDLKALVDYLRKFKPKKNEAVREGSV